MFYIQLNIGRGSGADEMAPGTWEKFRRECGAVLIGIEQDVIARTAKTFPLEHHYGFGRWNGEDEFSCHISLLIDAVMQGPHVAQAMVEARRELAKIAKAYGQDCIGLVTGSRLIKAAE